MERGWYRGSPVGNGPTPVSRQIQISIAMNDHATQWNHVQETVEQLTPAQKLRLIEELARSLHTAATEAKPRYYRTNLDRLRRELAGLPVHNPADGFSNRDHDSELYGEQR